MFQLWDDSGSWGAQNNDPGLAGGVRQSQVQVGKRGIRGQPGVPHELPAGWEEERRKVEEKREGGRQREGASPHALLGLWVITLTVSKLLSELQGLPLQTAGKFWQQKAGLGPLSTRVLEKARNRNPSPFAFLS